MIRLAEEADVDAIMPFMSENELSRFALAGLSARVAVKAALGPFTYCGVVHGEIACMFGIKFAAQVDEFPTLWLIKTPLIDKYKIKFLRENKKFMEWAVKQYGTIESHVLKSNRTSLIWLKWLGFEEVDRVEDYIRMRKNA